jgi:aquaporin Z
VTASRHWLSAPRPGVHPVEWLCEAIGTMILLVGGLSAVCLDFGRGSWVAEHLPSTSLRLLITGALFAATGSLVAISPIGRRSGAHLNPAVTLAFRITGHVHPHDLAGYWAAQFVGALCGAGVIRLMWGGVARSVNFGVTHPGRGLTAAGVLGVEFLMSAILLVVILAFVSSRALMHWTPLAAWVVITILVWQGAPYTGTSLNPARSAGPAVIAGDLRDLWVYLVAPLLAAVAVALVVRMLPTWRPLTARLFNDPRYPTTMGSAVADGPPAIAKRATRA